MREMRGKSVETLCIHDEQKSINAQSKLSNQMCHNIRRAHHITVLLAFQEEFETTIGTSWTKSKRLVKTVTDFPRLPHTFQLKK